MERLWTPWRRAFVEGTDTRAGECFLCTIAAEHNARNNLVTFRAERVFVLLNRYPYNSGHLMVAPYEHTGDLARLDVASANELMQVTQRAVDVLEGAYHPDAFNVGLNLGKAAGAGVPDHLHVHIVPRWSGDTNFMPMLSGTRVISESVQSLYEKLMAAPSSDGDDEQ